jgi:hypothetical protein
MEQVQVSVVPENGQVLIEQFDQESPEYSGSIKLQPEQIDMLCDWLRQARDEAIALRATKEATSR